MVFKYTVNFGFSICDSKTKLHFTILVFSLKIRTKRTETGNKDCVSKDKRYQLQNQGFVNVIQFLQTEWFDLWEHFVEYYILLVLKIFEIIIHA